MPSSTDPDLPAPPSRADGPGSVRHRRGARLRRRRTGRVLLAAGLLLAGVPLPAVAGGAPTVAGGAPTAAGDDGVVRWSVAPADAGGPDGRRRVTVSLPPGGRAEDRVAVRNLGSDPVTFRLVASDGLRTASGRFDILPDDVEPSAGGAWITVPGTVEVGPGETEIVPFTVEVPPDATPGEYPAGITAGLTASGTQVDATYRVGARVDVVVEGEVRERPALRDVTARYVPGWNPFAPGRIVVTGTAANEGNTTLAVSLSAWRDDGPPLAAGTDPVELIVGDEVTLDAVVDRVWPLGPVSVTASLTGTSSAGALTRQADVVARTVWALPVPQLCAVVVAAAGLWSVHTIVRHRRHRLAALLDRARAEGARTARAD